MKRKHKKYTIYFSLLMITILLFGLSACSEENVDKEESVYYSKQEDAITHFSEEENINGSIELINTTKNEQILLAQKKEHTYFGGELLKDEKGYYYIKQTGEHEIPSGAGWEMTTKNQNHYTFYLNEEKEDSEAILLSNGEYYMQLVEGHQISNDDTTQINAIQHIEVVKD